jgi:organic radical activating enzyme
MTVIINNRTNSNTEMELPAWEVANNNSTSTRKGSLVEIFSAIQGEGLWVGYRQIFVRFLGCDLHCDWCDTPATHTKVRDCRVEVTPGRRDFKNVSNPMTSAELLDLVLPLNRFKHHSVSLTGGEPLLYANFLEEFLPQLRQTGLKIYLETHGGLPEKLKQVLDLVDIVSMDIKLPSSYGGEDLLEVHRQFLKISSAKELYVKIVLTGTTKTEELEAAAKMMANTYAAPLVLQPVTPYGKVRKVPSPEQMLNWQELCLQYLPDVRVIPQTHKIIGQI